MSRSPVTLRMAEQDDVPVLLDLWESLTSRSVPGEDPVVGVKSAIERCHSESDQRIMVATISGVVVGVVHLSRGLLTPVSTELAIRMNHLAIADGQPSDVIARALTESAVAWAEAECIGSVLGSSPANSREANRFMARLGLTQVATVRVAATTSLRAKLPRETPGLPGGRRTAKTDRLLAARRSLRRGSAV